MINRIQCALLCKFSIHWTLKHIYVKCAIKYNYQYMCQKYQTDLYVLSIAEPIAVDDSMYNQIRNQTERLNKASADVAKITRQ